MKMKMDLECIGMRLREKRMENEWSQEALACDVDLSTVYIGMVERGEKVPRLSTFLRIMKSLGATPGEILRDLFPEPPMDEFYRYKDKMNLLSPREQKKVMKIIDTLLEMGE